MIRVTLLCFAAIICLIGPTYGRPRIRIYGSTSSGSWQYWYIWVAISILVSLCCSYTFWRWICTCCLSERRRDSSATGGTMNIVMQPTYQPGVPVNPPLYR